MSTAAQNSLPPLQPLNNYLLIREGDERAVSAAGVLLPSQTLGQAVYAEVVAAGEKVADQFDAGDEIVYKSADAVAVYADGQQYRIIKADVVLAKRRKPETP